MSLLDRITINPNQCGGRPCIRGMRIRVVDILDMLKEGVSESEILNDFPDLVSDDIRACLQYQAIYRPPVVAKGMSARAKDEMSKAIVGEVFSTAVRGMGNVAFSGLASLWSLIGNG